MSAARPLVCMVAYTEYATDARIRREGETLAAHGFRVMCLANRIGDTPRSYELHGVTVRELDVPKYRGKSTGAYACSYLRFVASASAACLGLLWRGELDVVHAHNLPDFLVFAGLLPRLLGRKVVLDVHDSNPETFATKFSGGTTGWRLLCAEERISAMLAHRVICVNHLQRDTLVARGIAARKTFVSMNVPDNRVFVPVLRGGEAPEPGALNVVYHGTMAARLGVDLVIRAVALLRDRIPGLQLHLWGHGDDLESFQALARELQVADRVQFSGRMWPLDQLPSRLSTMDVGVVGNRRSVASDLMLPVKLLEYVALGIPTVVPRLKTIEHYFDDEMVTYFEPEDVSSLAGAIARLQGDPTARRDLACRARRFLDQHGWHQQGPEFVSFYEQLLRGDAS